ncbi:N-acetylmuramoyl-L-alanine amidase [Nonomuraea sp. NEAU-A123]|uniref:peptidoglycan recognition protein family protein n=1 Tax=Nonomuraea sp. NEAU-A123 TaxID=2839649 RepID=UPI001BE46CFA|nr:N-acetylmuramoyl-L-alanine amidase [Nonomuraea sp. NEAU-A123]MBT2226234.1 peptidoglycan-binding protein [Nonomuraea sp. NEAU-A123]
MIDLVDRAGWRARETRGEVVLRARPLGVKIHYVGEHVAPDIVTNHSGCVTLVKAIQRQHMDVNLWADIGYTGLVCPHRKVFEGRGLHILPAANGKGLNADHYAFCALVGDSGLVMPPPLMLHGLVDAIDWARSEGGAGRDVKGHRDGYSTTCPGKWLYDWIGRGYQRPDDDASGDEPVEAPPWPGRILEYPPVMTGEDVERWQGRMKRRGWSIVVDGRYGSASRDVCRAFQREKGLRLSGKVTRETWEAAWTAPIT